MRIEPKTDQQLREIEESNLLPDGTYDFEVISAVDKQSKSGNDMAEIKLRIDDERQHIITDYLVAIDSMAYKVKHFAESVGLLDEYNAGHMPAEQMVGCVGRAKIKTQAAKGEYKAKNVVADYVPNASAQPRAKAPADLDDEIPF
jgi:hypothetical protein